MFRKRSSRAGQAWDQAVSAAHGAGEAARSAGRRTRMFAGKAQSRAGSAKDEARWRVGATKDALTGRRSSTRWFWVLAAAGSGLVMGWLAGSGARKVVTASQERPRSDAAKVDASANPEF